MFFTLLVSVVVVHRVKIRRVLLILKHFICLRGAQFKLNFGKILKKLTFLLEVSIESLAIPPSYIPSTP